MQNHNITLRTAVEDDIPAIGALYTETVRNVNSIDYPAEQIDVWSLSGHDSERWKKHVAEQYFVLALIDDVIAGFGSIDPNGYLDFMYVHKDYQRMGVAKALLGEIERKAVEQKNPQIYSHVSKTARGFFEKFGYKHVRDLNDPYKGVIFINNLMVKNFAGKNLNGDIKTKRVLLRRYTEADRETSMRLSLDKDVMQFIGGEHPETEKEASMIFDKCFEVYKGWLGEKPLGLRRFEIWGIEYEKGLIGHFELKETQNTLSGELEIVYFIDKNYWGLGIIPEVIKEITAYAGSGDMNVIATISPDNIKTVKALKKVGIKKEMWVGEGEDKVYKVWL